MAGELGQTAELDGADIIENADHENIDMDPLFEGEDVSEEDLMGEDTTAEETADAEPTGDEAEKESEETKEEESEDESGESDESDEESEEDKEPEPNQFEEKAKGLEVALHQERTKTKELKAQVEQTAQQYTAHIQQLNAKIASLQAPSDGGKFKDFKVLSKQEYLELDAEDPAKAAEYMYDLREYERYQASEAQRAYAEQQQQATYRNLVNEGARAISEILPGVYEKTNEDAPKILEYADKALGENLVNLLTDPAVKLVNPKGQQFVLGRGAAEIVKFLKGTYESEQNKPDIDKLREEITAELMPELEKKAQATVMEKLKNDPDGAFRSLDQASSSSSKDVKPIDGYVTETQLSRMTEAEEAKLLGA